MYFINKISLGSAIDFAAEELKKYLRMMMPDGETFNILYNPGAVEGYRLGLMSDFGLDTSDAEDTELDDIIYIDTKGKSGIIAGSNPRSVLIAVYEYLRQNGCRWLLPGVDGEYIPMQDIKSVTYRHKPSMRYRGWCDEGAEYQQCMLDAIEFIPKVGMNVFMLEFGVPIAYYGAYYKHSHNEENRPPEPVTPTTVLQWKRQCETEIAKRGLQFHDMGHGWTVDSLGINSSLRSSTGDNEKLVSDEARQYLALINGERKLYKNAPNWTNFCMSNPKAQKMFAQYVANYAQGHSNSDYLHVWLGDMQNNHCECENCRKKRPSDWYVILLNMIDEELTKRRLDTRIVFIVYVDTSWAPVMEKIHNQDRFTLMLAPITRNYGFALPEGGVKAKTVPYERNKLKLPESLEEYFAYLDEWRNMWHGANIVYEYHFWNHQCYDPAGIEFSRRINEDVKVYKENNIVGIIEDGSQRSFFPTGLAFYTYARTLYDTSLSAEEIAKDYFDTAFAEASDQFYAYLEKLGDAFDFYYLIRNRSADINISPFYNPQRAAVLREFDQIEEEGRALIQKYYNFPHRLGTVSVRLLEKHLDFAVDLAKVIAEKAVGNDDEAAKILNEFRIKFGKEEALIEKYFDHSIYFYTYGWVVDYKTNKSEPVIAVEE